MRPVTYLRPAHAADQPRPPVARVQLTPWQRMEVEAARELLGRVGELLDAKPHAYVAGRLEGAAANLLDILDALAEVE